MILRIYKILLFFIPWQASGSMALFPVVPLGADQMGVTIPCGVSLAGIFVTTDGRVAAAGKMRGKYQCAGSATTLALPTPLAGVWAPYPFVGDRLKPFKSFQNRMVAAPGLGTRIESHVRPVPCYRARGHLFLTKKENLIVRPMFVLGHPGHCRRSSAFLKSPVLNLAHRDKVKFLRVHPFRVFERRLHPADGSVAFFRRCDEAPLGMRLDGGRLSMLVARYDNLGCSKRKWFRLNRNIGPSDGTLAFKEKVATGPLDVALVPARPNRNGARFVGGCASRGMLISRIDGRSTGLAMLMERCTAPLRDQQVAFPNLPFRSTHRYVALRI